MIHSRGGEHAKIRRILTSVLKQPAILAEMSTSELDLTLRLARPVQLLGRLGHQLRSAGLLEEMRPIAVDHLAAAHTMAEARARMAKWELDRIAWATDSIREAPLVVLKGGAYLLLDLPNAHGRVFADVDLMTSEERLEQVEAKLNAKGWATTPLSPYDDNYYRRWTHELPPMIHGRREMEIDLHHNILPRTARLKPSSAAMVESSVPLPGSCYRVLCNEDIVLHAMVHLFSDSDLADKLRDLVDIADLVEHFSRIDGDFWNVLVARAETLGLRRPAYYGLRYSQLLLRVSIPASVLNAIAHWGPPGPVQFIMDRLVPRALFPMHPDRRCRVTATSRLLLYMRSHWIRMPPWLLCYHLSYKFFAKRFGKPG
jgi:hypothetical protein